jgi:hypothetical protein
MNAKRRTGSVLAITILMVLIIGLLGMALMDRTLNSSARAAWSRDHLSLRLLAESAAEELFTQVAKGANDSSAPVFQKLRTLDVGDAAIPLDGLKLQEVRKDLPNQERAMGATIDLVHEVAFEKVKQVSRDGTECRGVLRITVAATAGRRFFRMTEKVSIERSFRVARSTLPHPLQLDALLVKRLPKKKQEGQNGQDGQSGPGGPSGAGGPDGQDGPGGGNRGPDGADGAQGGRQPGAKQGENGEKQGEKKPHSYHKPHVQGARTIAKIVGEEGKSLDPSPEGWVKEINRAIRSLDPRMARRRAHYTTRMPRQLRFFMQGLLRKNKPVHGVFVSNSRRPLMLKFPRFSGQAVIIARGPVIVGDITVANPKKDRLTIVSGSRVTVVGAKVDAHLVSFRGRRSGVRFARKTRVNGSVISQRVPKGRKLSQEDFDASEISGVEGENYDGNRRARPPGGKASGEELKEYTALFSPHATRVNHALD